MTSGRYAGRARPAGRPPRRCRPARRQRVAIAEPAHHVRVAIAQVLPLGHAQEAHRALELGGTELAEPPVVVGRVHLGDDDLAQLAAGAGHEDDAMAVGDGLGHRPAGPDRLVVGVGVDGHQGRPIGAGASSGPGVIAASIIGRCYRGARRARPRAAVYHRPHARGRPGTARRPARHRLLDGPGRAALHDAPGRPRRRRRQGRATRGRRDARLGAAVGRRERRRHADRGLLPRGQPQQALDPARPPPPGRRRDPARLLADADVLVENFRVGGLARLGFDDATLERPEPAPGPPRDQRLRHRPARRPTGPATTSSSRRRAG